MGGITVQVGAGANDGYWIPTPGTFSNTGTHMRVGKDSSGYQNHIFARWTGITIPAGVTITRSYVSLYQSAATVGDPYAYLYFNKYGSPSAPTDAAAAGARALTTNYVTWNLPDDAGWTNSPDITDIINELIGLYGPYSSGTMLMLLRGLITASTAIYTATSYDSDPSLSPKLTIEWAGGSNQVRIIGMAR